MASGLVAGTARGPGAGIGQRAIRAAKDRLFACGIPHVPASTRIPIPFRAASRALMPRCLGVLSGSSTCRQMDETSVGPLKPAGVENRARCGSKST
jgi:hypothetical protein